MSTTQQPTSKYRITREPWDAGRASRARFMAVLRSMSLSEQYAPMERIAASCIHHAVSELWYGYYPSEAHYQTARSQERRERALGEIEYGGIDLWLSVLNLPVDVTLSWIVSLNPFSPIPARIDKRGKYDRKNKHNLTQ